MHKRFLSAGAALALTFAAAGPAFAMSRLTVHRGRGILLPVYVTSKHYWLYPGPIPRRRSVADNYDYIRLVAEPVGNIVPVGPDLGFPW
ncbi:hypothetical protein K9U39_11200 [Rhodoblastus acidophilus]|uniref:Uncharacterized protein n=1 Tax=Candidatus Rhodoblastus alkanivorans TaxID=2954117 RepID=A0ABS9Z916_9HYPH|nr:hypothetical protein [Candidatus Rhodoblastus alkanivorans]MCI4678898.1 hypothetical protein [Candidatus Rhodoblastus alkanivorans]MCI4684178.1 hypothetical protein [Candidatus Rhodoblastus alkanivorans]MDI4641499.1 hypothetical protein [Rhodoblastus acidophilus]